MVYFSIKFGLGSGSDTRNRNIGNGEKNRSACTAMQYALAEANRTRASGHHKTAANYLTAMRSLTAFMGRADWRFADLTPGLLADYQQWLAGRGLSMNTVSAYMRSLRTLYNRAEGTDGTAEMFGSVYTGRTMTAKRSAEAADLKRLLGLQLRPGSPLALARDLFLFSFYAMGMPFADMARLSRSQISGGMINYARQKTSQRVSVRIEPCMQTIIDRYADGASDLVFPMLRGVPPGHTHHTYLNRLRAYNYALARLSDMIGATRRLSSYVARHTWASMAYTHSLDLQLIAKAMGHTKLSTTLTYIRSLFDPSLADANRRMIGELGL